MEYVSFPTNLKILAMPMFSNLSPSAKKKKGIVLTSISFVTSEVDLYFFLLALLTTCVSFLGN